MLTFQPLEITHLPQISPYFAKTRARLCDSSVGTAFLWRKYYGTHFALWDDVLYLRMHNPENGETVFLPPLGGDADSYRLLADCCRERGQPLRLAIVPQEELPLLREVFGEFDSHFLREWCDYLYHSADMRDFPGKKFHGQRGHLRRFLAKYPDWRFAVLDGSNMDDVRAFLTRFHSADGQHTEALTEEYERILELLAHWDAYGQLGGILYAAGRVAGFSIGEIVNDTLVIHIEKADRDFDGVYPMLVNQFARRYSDESVPYINREEDVGNPGLRTSKLSYHPVALLEKHTVYIP